MVSALTKRWKSPCIIHWDDFRNRIQPTDSAEEALMYLISSNWRMKLFAGGHRHRLISRQRVPEALMPSDWKEKVTDAKERAIFTALADPLWDFRTVQGIARSAGVEEREVESVLAKYPTLVRVSPIPDSLGRELYALRSRSRPKAEDVAIAQRVISKNLR